MNKSVLMAVYNPIEYDGRVKRSAFALAEIYTTIVICPAKKKGGDLFDADSFEVQRVSLPEIKIQAFKQLFFWGIFIFRAISLRPSVIYAHDFFLVFPALVAAFITRARLVYDAHELIIPNKKEVASKREIFFYTLEKMFIKFFDLVIAANQERADIMKEHYGLQKPPLVIRNIPPLPKLMLDDESILKIYTKLRREEREDIHVVYMGDINLERGIGALIGALNYLPARYKCILIGGGPSEHAIKISYDRELNSGRLRLVGSIPNHYIPDLLRQCDIGFLSYSMVGRNNIYCAPNKIFEYAQSGLPIVATSQPPIVSIIRKYKIGELIPASDENMPLKIADSILKISLTNAYKNEITQFISENRWETEGDRLRNGIAEVFN